MLLCWYGGSNNQSGYSKDNFATNYDPMPRTQNSSLQPLPTVLAAGFTLVEVRVVLGCDGRVQHTLPLTAGAVRWYETGSGAIPAKASLSLQERGMYGCQYNHIGSAAVFVQS